MAPRLAELQQSKLPTSHSAAPVAHGPHLSPRAERLCAATRAALVVVGCYCCRSRSYTMKTNRTHCETVTAPCATCTPAPTPGTRVAPIIRARRVTAAKSRVPSERTARGNCAVRPRVAGPRAHRSTQLGLHYTIITHAYNAGQCTQIYLESSNTPTAEACWAHCLRPIFI